MAMILPERTVDAWTAAYITGRRWRARLWSPTEQRRDEAYDLAVGLGAVAGMRPDDPGEPWPDKVFVLEHKGVDEDTRGRWVTLRLRQHLAHVKTDAHHGGHLIYYLLPSAPWSGRQAAPAGTVPPTADLRTRGPGGPGFQMWSWITDAISLDSWLRLQVSAGQLAWTPVGGRRPDWHLRLPCSLLPTVVGIRTLRDFMSDVRDCTAGRAPSSVGPSARTPDTDPVDPQGWLRWQPRVLIDADAAAYAPNVADVLSLDPPLSV